MHSSAWLLVRISDCQIADYEGLVLGWSRWPASAALRIPSYDGGISGSPNVRVAMVAQRFSRVGQISSGTRRQSRSLGFTRRAAPETPVICAIQSQANQASRP